ncbi:unnamed protein product, partial [Mesorhabditis belari]|uniref:Uncharacterized protein n=1 Tax=Mesorhabditis belari TaxID=2138241 RepID=A0AAF3FMD6_9BILA
MLFEVNFDEYSMHSVSQSNSPSTSFTQKPTPTFEFQLPKFSLQMDTTLNVEQPLRRVPSAPLLSLSPSTPSFQPPSTLFNNKHHRASSESPLSSIVTKKLSQVSTNLFQNVSTSFLNLTQFNL